MKNSENNPNINHILNENTESTEDVSAHYNDDINNKVPFWQRLKAGLNEFYHAPYRQTMHGQHVTKKTFLCY